MAEPTSDTWQGAERLLVDEAEAALRDHGEVQPGLVAFAGASLRFIAWLRPFEPGGAYTPMVELLALAAPMDCDRLMLSFGGRMWHPDEPAPIDEDGDHRQRAIIIHAVDGAAGQPRPTSAVHPFHVDAAGDVVLGARWDPGPASSWVSDVLATAVRRRSRMRTTWAEIAKQAARVDRLGHRLYVPPDVLLLMADAMAAEQTHQPRADG